MHTAAQSERVPPGLEARLDVALCIVACGLLVWAPALDVGYLGDDHSILAHGAALHVLPYGHPEPLAGWQSEMAGRWRFFRPLTLGSTWIDARLGADALVSHALNLSLHLGAALLAAGLVLRLSGGLALAAFAGLLYAVFPTAVEPIAWVAARGVMLCTFFCLAALRATGLAFDAPKPLRFELLAAAATAAALASKEPALLLPGALGLLLLALAVLEQRPLARAARHLALPVLAYAVVFAFRWSSLDGSLGGYADSPRQTASLGAFASAIVSNVTAVTWPWSELAPGRLPFHWAAAAAGAMLLLTLLICWNAGRGLRAIALLGLALGALFLSPSLGYLQGGFDAPGLRHQLSPLLGVVLVWTALLGALARRGALGRGASVALAVALVAGAGWSARRHVAPWSEASGLLAPVRAALLELPDRIPSGRLVVHGLPTALGPCAMAPGMLPGLYLRPFRNDPAAARRTRLVHQELALSGDIDRDLLRALLDPCVRVLAWDQAALDFRMGGWPFSVGHLRALAERVEPNVLRASGVELPALRPEGLESLVGLEPGQLVEVEAALGPPFGVFLKRADATAPWIERTDAGDLRCAAVGTPRLLVVGTPAAPRALGSAGVLCLAVTELVDLNEDTRALPTEDLPPGAWVQVLFEDEAGVERLSEAVPARAEAR